MSGSGGFVGFGSAAATASPGFVPLVGIDEAEGAHQLPGEVRLILRKMGKKDVTTRLKVSNQSYFLKMDIILIYVN